MSRFIGLLCRIHSKNGYFTSPTSLEEANFPLAYGILVHKDFEQFERVFRAVYMPQNYYCIHVDKKSPVAFYKAIVKLTDCFENAYVVGTREDVRWGEFSLLTAELTCARSLLKYRNWKYYINLTGFEFPLVSNRQLVRVFKAYNGSNDINVQEPNKQCTPGVSSLTTSGILDCHRRLQYLGNIHMKSSVTFFTGDPKEKSYQYEARYKNWMKVQPKYMGGKRIKCVRWRNDICIPGVSDMVNFMRPNNTKLFLNKVFQNFQYLTYDCLEDYQRNLTIQSTSTNFTFDDSYYRNLKFVKNKRDCH
ncbi:LOW QUALITY PROTEIN: putative beta-1,3-galactosyl-O-glycosyl-glycoprotein beta-1,6-N-acetylglucosaminyltransferase 7 [Tubulanus polymorphus]|uniref:LOW QUALITY PROTEIN: putative beta-1,3-galactosyl-O-glycosyl-glycoprotein beta-1,6-N-acetylglucosaminyltransferase 7 n=1 Tax=Tubulanus polymorphus TaxID=672921 RepID=UPI003DA1EB1E